jgi:hypothetical protein
MEEPTLADAERIIERTKAARGTCREKCDIVSYEVTINVVNGSAPPLDDTLRSDLAIMVGRHLGPDWIHAPNSPGFLRRCQSCATEPQFPWADQLQADRVLEFMKPRAAADCAFYLGELRETLG